MRLALLCLLVAGSCKTPQERHEAAARVNLAALTGLLGPATSAPAMDEASSKALASVQGFKLRYLDSNALLIHLEDLGNPTLRRVLPLRLDHRSPTVDLATALGLVRPEAGVPLETRYDPGLGVKSNMDSVWQRMGELRFVLVVRTRMLREAEELGNDKFASGAWEGEVLVFELAGRKLLGGFPFAGRNDASVETRPGRDKENLAADLMLNTRGNLNGKVRALIPGVQQGDEAN